MSIQRYIPQFGRENYIDIELLFQKIFDVDASHLHEMFNGVVFHHTLRVREVHNSCVCNPKLSIRFGQAPLSAGEKYLPFQPIYGIFF